MTKIRPCDKLTITDIQTLFALDRLGKSGKNIG